MATAVEVEGLGRRFGDVSALRDLDLQIAEGEVLALLGPNGAGKTTLIRILSTLLQPSAGRAWVAGFDVMKAPVDVRARIGLTGQYASVDADLTGLENLELLGGLLGLVRQGARGRAIELLDRFSLRADAGRRVGTYSGAMRRRLDLAASLVGSPQVVFLDEPTTGLDPQSRAELWSVVRELAANGTTVLLTTQYMDEADALADRIVVIDHGHVVADGSASALKALLGRRRVDVTFRDAEAMNTAQSLLRSIEQAAVRSGEDYRLRITVSDANHAAGVVSELRQAGLLFESLEISEPSLDEVFLELTGDAPLKEGV